MWAASLPSPAWISTEAPKQETSVEGERGTLSTAHKPALHEQPSKEITKTLCSFSPPLNLKMGGDGRWGEKISRRQTKSSFNLNLNIRLIKNT